MSHTRMGHIINHKNCKLQTNQFMIHDRILGAVDYNL